MKPLDQALGMAEQKLVTLKMRLSVHASRIPQSSHVGRLALNSPSAKATLIFFPHVSATRTFRPVPEPPGRFCSS